MRDVLQQQKQSFSSRWALQPPQNFISRCPLFCLQQFQQRFAEAIEEAKELWDRRNGRDPTTSHNPPDFLDPNYGVCMFWRAACGFVSLCDHLKSVSRMQFASEIL